jgi:zinc transport system substrate-binding protein
MVQRTVLESDLFCYGVEGFQPWADDLVTSLRDDDVDVVAAGTCIDLIEGGHDHSHDEEHEGGNDGDGDGAVPWEWAGLYHPEAGTYTYTFHEGGDPKIQL